MFLGSLKVTFHFISNEIVLQTLYSNDLVRFNYSLLGLPRADCHIFSDSSMLSVDNPDFYLINNIIY